MQYASDTAKRRTSASISEAHSKIAEDGTASLTTDEAVLAALGYKQEFKREFTKLEVFGVAFSIIGVLPSIASVLVYAIPNGGTSAMVWGWAFCSVLILSVGLAMAELGSAMPTSGGLYYWTFAFAPKRWRRLLAWLVGYSNTTGLIAGVASVDWGGAVQIMAAASIGSDMEFAPTTGQYYAVFLALLVCHALICSCATRVLARLQNLYIFLNVMLCLAVIIALPAATPREHRNTAAYALGSFEKFTSWPDGFAFILSFLAPLWVIGAFDSSVHISEEATNARTAVPFAIIGSIVSAGVLGWAINMAIAFSMGNDLEAVLASPIGQPLAVIFFNSFGKSGTLALWAVIVVVQFMMGSSILLASSRQTFAFARDGGLPLSSLIYRIHPRTGTPVTGVWLAALCAALLGLLAFAGPSAVSAIFAMGVAGQQVAYTVPIAARAFARGETRWEAGPFCLGKWSKPVAALAVLWMGFTNIVVFFPATPAPTADEMNYAVVVLGGVLLLALAYYYCPVYGGVNWFEGPVRTVGEVGGVGGKAGSVDEELEKSREVEVGVRPVDGQGAI